MLSPFKYKSVTHTQNANIAAIYARLQPKQLKCSGLSSVVPI